METVAGAFLVQWRLEFTNLHAQLETHAMGFGLFGLTQFSKGNQPNAGSHPYPLKVVQDYHELQCIIARGELTRGYNIPLDYHRTT